MRRLTFITILIYVLLLSRLCLAVDLTVHNLTCTGAVTDCGIGSPIPAGITGQFFMKTALLYGFVSMSGDISCSMLTPGLCTVTNTHNQNIIFADSFIRPDTVGGSPGNPTTCSLPNCTWYPYYQPYATRSTLARITNNAFTSQIPTNATSDDFSVNMAPSSDGFTATPLVCPNGGGIVKEEIAFEFRNGPGAETLSPGLLIAATIGSDQVALDAGAPYNMIHPRFNAQGGSIGLWDSLAGGGPSGTGSARAFGGGCVRIAGGTPITVAGGGLGPMSFVYGTPLVTGDGTVYHGSLELIPGTNQVKFTVPDGSVYVCTDPLIPRAFGNTPTLQLTSLDSSAYYPAVHDFKAYCDPDATNIGTFTSTVISDSELLRTGGVDMSTLTGLPNTALGGVQPSLDDYNWGGLVNVMAFGVAKDITPYTVGNGVGNAITAALASFKVPHSAGFRVNQGFHVPHGGATTSLTASVTGPTVTPTCGSGCIDNTTVYTCVPFDSSDGNPLPHAGTAVVAGAASRNKTTNFNTITCPAVTSAVKHCVYRGTGLLGCVGTADRKLIDYGQPVVTTLTPLTAATGLTLPVTAQTRGYSSFLLSVTEDADKFYDTLTPNVAPVTTLATAQIYHDESFLMYQFANGLLKKPKGTEFYFPSGNYGFFGGDALGFSLLMTDGYAFVGGGQPVAPDTEQGDSAWYEPANYGGAVLMFDRVSGIGVTSNAHDDIINLTMVGAGGNATGLNLIGSGKGPRLINSVIGNFGTAAIGNATNSSTTDGGGVFNSRISGNYQGMSFNAASNANDFGIYKSKFNYNRADAISLAGTTTRNFALRDSQFLSDGLIAPNDLSLANCVGTILDGLSINNVSSATGNIATASTCSNSAIDNVRDISLGATPWSIAGTIMRLANDVLSTTGLTVAAGGTNVLLDDVKIGGAYTNSGTNTQVRNTGCYGTQALSSGTPSTATVSNACIPATCIPNCNDQTAASAIKCVATAGSLAMTGPNTITDTIAWSCL